MPEPGHHVPSAARWLIQEAKRRGPSGAISLVDDARRLDDPYFVGSVLFFLSSHVNLPLPEARDLALEAVGATARVDRDWRRAEVLTELSRELRHWREDERDRRIGDAMRAIEDAIVAEALRIPPGKGLSDALQGVGQNLSAGSPHLRALLARALTHEGYALDDAKALVRAWALAHGPGLQAHALEGLVAAIASAPDAAVRAQVLGYAHLQAHKLTRGAAPPVAFETALAAIPEAPAEGRLEALRYLATVAQTEEDLKRVREGERHLPDAEARVRLLSTLGGFADKRGLRALGTAWLNEGARAAEAVPDPAPRSVTRANLAKGFSRSGMRDAAHALVEAARADVEQVADPVERLRVSHRVRQAAEAVQIALPHDWPPGVADIVQEKTTPQREERAPAGRPRDRLALHGAYEGGLSPAHLRAVARAAPLCDAFDLDLVLVGFPAANAQELAERAAQDTNVGGGGRHLRALADAGRIELAPESREWPALGDVVIATTARPDPRKAIGMEEAVAKAGAHGRVTLIMGLGKNGLPRSVLDAAPHHLELTGARVSFETAIAMGVMVERLRASRERAAREQGPGSHE